MGQKVHPVGFRLGIVKNWDSVWYAPSKQFATTLISDMQVRAYLQKALAKASVSKIVITRPAKSITVTLHSARPGMIIGRKGDDIEKLRKAVSTLAGVPAQINLIEIRRPELDAKLVAENVASQLERRILFRRAMRKVMQSAMRSGAKGVKVRVSGRLNGAEIARCEWNREGRIPLHTLRSDIDYAEAQAKTTYGIIGIKVWIYKGEILGPMPPVQVAAEPAEKNASPAGSRRHAKREKA